MNVVVLFGRDDTTKKICVCVHATKEEKTEINVLFTIFLGGKRSKKLRRTTPPLHTYSIVSYTKTRRILYCPSSLGEKRRFHPRIHRNHEKDFTEIKNMLKNLETILENAPEGWYGTTYPNDWRFVGPETFKSRVGKMLVGTSPIEKLEELYPEDYVRLGSPFSNILEWIHAKNANVPSENAFAFGSNTLPLISVLLVTNEEVEVRYESEKSSPILTGRQKHLLSELYGCKYTETFGSNEKSDRVVVRVLENTNEEDFICDAKIDRNGMLYVKNTTKIPLQDIKDNKGKMITEGIHTIRKRLGGPPPTPEAVRRLRNLCGKEEKPEVSPDVDELKQHLKTLAGCGQAGGDVLISTVGLSSLAACVMAALEMGNKEIDVVMCSTACVFFFYSYHTTTTVSHENNITTDTEEVVNRQIF